MRSTGLRDIIKHDALLWLVVLQQLWLVYFDPCWSGICSLGGLLSHGSPVVVFFDRGHPRFRNFYSPIPVNVVGVKSSSQCLRAFNQGFPLFFFRLFLLQKAEVFWRIWKISISCLLWSDRWKLHGEIQRHAIVITYMFMTNNRCEDTFV